MNAMQTRIEPIDAIARNKQQDVLFLEFRSQKVAEEGDMTLFDLPGYSEENEDVLVAMLQTGCDYHGARILLQVIAWLNKQHIGWRRCAPFTSETCTEGFAGQIYLEVPCDDNDPGYRAVRDYLENPDGSMRFPEARLCVLPLEKAMKNAEHKENCQGPPCLP